MYGYFSTWGKIEIYFNFIGEYIPPTMAEKEPTPEELEEMRKKEARKDKLHLCAPFAVTLMHDYFLHKLIQHYR